MTFAEYVTAATKGTNINIAADVIHNSAALSRCLGSLPRAAIFYALRLLLAPIVELYILLDYQHFLMEHQFVQHLHLLPLFDPLLSPRNLVLLCVKKKCDNT